MTTLLAALAIVSFFSALLCFAMRLQYAYCECKDCQKDREKPDYEKSLEQLRVCIIVSICAWAFFTIIYLYIS